MGAPLVEVAGLAKSYRMGTRSIPVLEGIDLAVDRGDFLAVTGASGSGKSTLLQILGCLDTQTAGSYRLSGREVSSLDDPERSRIRATRIGFVFQNFHLLPQLTVSENVALPFLYAPEAVADAGERVAAALAQVGLSHRADHRPAELSGGEMQRAAIARAIVVRPDLLLADEPTGNLDSATGAQVLGILEELNAGGATLVLVTHDHEIATRAARRTTIRDGRLVS